MVHLIINPEPTYTSREAAICRARREADMAENTTFYVVRLGSNQWRVQRCAPLSNYEYWTVAPYAEPKRARRA